VFVSDTRDRISELLAEGESVMGIARRLGLAEPTVSYHVDRLHALAAAAPVQSDAAEVPNARLKVRTRELVAELLAQGLTRAETARRLGLRKGTVSYHARRLGAPIRRAGRSKVRLARRPAVL
jgi:DNA-binding NarL/FixJ family response regulator